VRALTGGVELAAPYDEALRARLAREARLHPPEFLHEWLALRDPVRASALHPGDTYRVLRALEIAFSPSTGVRQEPLATLASEGLAWQTIFLDVPLAQLDARIADRTTRMLEGGLLEEAESVGSDAVAANAVGYPQALAFLSGWSTYEELRVSLERATRRYARRQRAWFRNERAALWLPPDRVAGAAREKLGWPANP
jgi:tRNA dimethylallyltransferase